MPTWIKHIALVWFILVSLRFLLPLISGKALFFGDNYSLLVPGKIFTADWIKKGELPLWNPYIFSGISWMGDLGQSVLYPSTLLFVFFEPGVALTLNAVVHVFIAMVGMYLLAKRYTSSHLSSLSASVLWGSSAQMVGHVNNIICLQSISYMPILLFLLLRKRWNVYFLLLSVLMLSMQILGGYPYFVLITLLGALCFAVIEGKQKLLVVGRRLIVVTVLSGLLCIPALLPFFDTFFQSTRTMQSVEQALGGSVHPLLIAKSFLPYVFDKPIDGIRWGPQWNGMPVVLFYLTWLGMFFAAIAFHFRKNNQVIFRFAIFSAICVVLSFGSYLPGFSSLLSVLPILTIFRTPSLLLSIANVSMIVLVSIGFGLLEKDKKLFNAIPRLKYIALFFFIFLALFVFMKLNFLFVWTGLDSILGHLLSSSIFHTLERDELIFSMIGTNIMVNLGLTLLGLAFLTRKKFTLLLCVLFVDMIWNTQGTLFYAPLKIYDKPSLALWERVPQDYQYRTLTRNGNAPYSDFQTYWEALSVRKPFSDSYIDDQELRHFEHLQRMRDGMTPDWNMTVGLPVLHGYTTLVPKNYASIWSKDKQASVNFVPPIQLSSQSEQLYLWSVHTYIRDTFFPVFDEEVLPKRILDEDQTHAIYELEALPRFRWQDGSLPEISDFKETPNTITFSLLSSQENATLVIADRYESGWSARVNGQKTVVAQTEGMRKLIVPEQGISTVFLEYEPIGWPESWAISAMTLITVLGYVYAVSSGKIKRDLLE